MTRLLSYLPFFGFAPCLLLAVLPLVSVGEPKQREAAIVRNESNGNLDMQLAKARLKLANLELKRVSAANKRLPGLYSLVTIELLRRDVNIAQMRLDALSRSGAANTHAAHLRWLESTVKIAEFRWKTAERLRERSPELSEASQVETQRLRAEVARLALARARDPARVATPVDHMQWQLDQLRQELLELTLRVEILSSKS